MTKLFARVTFVNVVVLLALGIAAVLLFTHDEVPEWLIGLVLLAQIGTPAGITRRDNGQESLT